MYRRYLLFLVWAVAIIFILLFGNNRVFPDGFLLSFLRFDQSQFDTSALSLFTLLGIYPAAFFMLFFGRETFFETFTDVGKLWRICIRILYPHAISGTCNSTANIFAVSTT